MEGFSSIIPDALLYCIGTHPYLVKKSSRIKSTCCSCKVSQDTVFAINSKTNSIYNNRNMGEILRSKVKVKSKEAVAGTSLSGFCTGALGAGASLYFTGTECTKVVYTSSSSGSTGYPRESYSTANIVRAIISLDWSRSSSVASFQYTIPEIPPSFHHQDGNGSYCCVSYQLKLQLGREIVEVVPIKIISKPSCNPPLPYLEEHVKRKIMLVCCIPKGGIEISIKVNDTRLAAGEKMKICLQIVNNSSVDIERISAVIKEQFDWQSCGHYTSDTTIVASQRFPDSIGKKCKAATKQAKANAVHSHKSDSNSIVSCNSSEACLRVPPEYSLQTCAGNLFEVKHYLSIVGETKCGFTNVKLHVPVQITSPRKSVIF